MAGLWAVLLLSPRQLLLRWVIARTIFVNTPGRDGYDVPFIFKLYGTFDLPYGFITSFFLNYRVGYPWGRSVSIVPPEDWAEDNNIVPWSVWVMLEPNGTRRQQDYINFDFHLEKNSSSLLVLLAHLLMFTTCLAIDMSTMVLTRSVNGSPWLRAQIRVHILWIMIMAG